MYLYEPLSLKLGLTQEKTEYLFGINSNSIDSDLIGFISTWIFYWIMIHALFYILGNIMQIICKLFYPKYGTNYVPITLQRYHMYLSEMAFPLYSTVPAFGDFLKKKGLSQTCDTIDECGGILKSILSYIIFFIILEFIVFFDHYYLLHVNKWGKKNLKHDLHHKFEKANEMTTFTGFAFDPIDGWSQGLGLVLAQLVVPVPSIFIIITSIITGIWTMYIHQSGVLPLPWPFMGSAYHFIHHKYNWYNFGFYTVFWDYIFGTLKHPKIDDWKNCKIE